MLARMKASHVPIVALALGMCLVLALLWVRYAHADSNWEVIQSFELHDMQWPSVEADIIGYKFDAAEIEALNAATVTGTSTTWELLPSNTTLIGDYCESSGYMVAVTHRVSLETQDDKECRISISVFPSSDAARAHFLARFAETSRLIEFVRVPNTQGESGDVCLVVDAAIEESTNEERVVHEKWEPSMSRELYAFYYNVFVHISIDRDSNLEAFGLLTDIVSEMESQLLAASGNPEYPDVSLALASATVQSEPLPGATVGLTHSAEWNEEPCTKHFFWARRQTNMKWNDAMDGLEPDTQNPFTYSRSFTSYLDDPENPTEAKGLTTNEVGHHHVVMVAWGDNLLPKVVYGPLEVTN
jgi:hypothetical protein